MLSTDEISAALDEQGFVILQRFLEPDLLDAVRNALAGIVDQLALQSLADGDIFHAFEDEPFETRLFKLYENCLDKAPASFRQNLHLKDLGGLFFHPELLDIVEPIIGPEIRLYPNYTVRPKLPEWERGEVLWHQDGGYTTGQADEQVVGELRMVNVWTPLVPVRENNGCMQFVPGSHKLGIVPHEKRKHYLEIAQDTLSRHRSRAVSIEIDPGDVVLFHNLLFHVGLPNRSKEIRWSLDWRYQDATQATGRTTRGHIARSHRNPSVAVKNAEDWATLSFV